MEREMAVNLLWEAERKAERAEAELLQCRAILDNAEDFSTSIHGGIEALVAQRHHLRERVEYLEREGKNARMFLAALIKGAGGQLSVPDEALYSISSKAVISVYVDKLHRATWIRVEEP